jgi:hypothetical protein
MLQRGPTPYNLYFKQKYDEWKGDFMTTGKNGDKVAFGDLARRVDSWIQSLLIPPFCEL